MSEIANLRTLLALDRFQKYGQVAEFLNISQPAVTKRIRALEASLGVKLVMRNGMLMELTPEARAIAEDALKLVEAYERLLRDSSRPEHFEGRITIGVIEVILRTWFSDFLGVLKEKYPKISIDVRPGNSTRLEADLLDRVLDISLMLPSDNLRYLAQFPAGSAAMGFFGPDGAQPLLGGPDAVQRIERFITFPEGSTPFFDLVRALDGSDRFRDTPIVAAEGASEIFLMAELGLGVGVAPLIARPKSAVRALEVDLEVPPLNFVASYLKSRESAQLRDICNLAQAAARQFTDRCAEGPVPG